MMRRLSLVFTLCLLFILPHGGQGLRTGAPESVGMSQDSGGAGLVSTASDYARFLQMMLNGGQLDGKRLLSRKTVELMTTSHTEDLGPSVVSPGYGFGYGFSVRESLGRSNRAGSTGVYFWGGIYGTHFWVDPKEQLIGVMMLQLLPRPDDRARELFNALTYQAIVD